MRHLVISALLTGTVVSAQDWRPSYPLHQPGALSRTRMAFDAAHGELVLFGGQLVPSPANSDTWTWNGTDWTQRAPTTSPPARLGHAMCYDAARQRVVVYGGLSGATLLNDTWEWDGTNWTHLSPATSPPARFWPTIAYDGTRTILFGGGSSAAPRNDTWAWNGVTWTQITTAHAPTPRYYNSLASNGAGEVLLFGGFDPTLGYLGDTWTFDGTDWTQRTPATSPIARGNCSMGYDPTSARYLLFSGTNSFFSSLEDTWTFAGGQWTQLATQRSPSSRSAGGAAWCPAQQRFVVLSADYLSMQDLKSTPMWEFGTDLASFVRWGPSECPPIDPPVLRAHQSQPILGTTFETRAESVTAVLHVLVLGVSDTAWSGGALPVNLAAIGTVWNCWLRVSPDVLLSLAFGQSAPWLLAVPNSPTLIGATVFAQDWTWGLGTFPTNLSASNAATLVVGAN